MKRAFLGSALLLSLMVAAGQRPAVAQYNVTYSQQQNWRAVLSADDQRDFDKYYSKWVEANRKGDRDDIAENASKMQDLMVRHNIPVGVPFEQIATSPAYVGAYPAAAYPPAAYPNGSYAYPASARLSADDQKKFDHEYREWLEAQRKGHQDDMDKEAREMQQIMARYNIASNVPFAVVASNGYAAVPVATTAVPVATTTVPVAVAPNPYNYSTAPQRLSAKDQHEFDEHYRHWVEARDKRDMDDVDKNARKMQDIMVRYNIPANVPFDQIATAGSNYR